MAGRHASGMHRIRKVEAVVPMSASSPHTPRSARRSRRNLHVSRTYGGAGGRSATALSRQRVARTISLVQDLGVTCC